MKNLDMYQIRKKLKTYFPDLDMKVWADAKHANLRLPEFFAELKLAKNGEQICIGTPLVYTKDGQPIESPKFSALVAKTCGLDMERLTCEQIVTVVNTIKTLRANVIKEMHKDESENKESVATTTIDPVTETTPEKPQNNYHKPNNGYQSNSDGARKPYNNYQNANDDSRKPYHKPYNKSSDGFQKPYHKPSGEYRPYRKDYQPNKEFNNPNKEVRYPKKDYRRQG